jgi:hypothetical protein
VNLPSPWPPILLAVEYAERLRVPLRWWVQATMLVASLWLAVVVALPTDVAWLITAAAMAVVAALLVSYGSARITVADGTLRAGRAHIPVSLLGAVTSLDADGVRRTAGVEADARAYLLLRPYLSRGVRVEVADPADPTPYWLVSTRRPDELAAALDRVGRQHRADPPDHGVRQED